MMRVRVLDVEDWLHPDEVVATVDTEDGAEQVVLSRSSIERDSILVGYPVGQRNGSSLLVELPRETLTGAWRVWVKKDNLVPA